MEISKNLVRGIHEHGYVVLEAYRYMIEFMNPESKTTLHVDENERPLKPLTAANNDGTNRNSPGPNYMDGFLEERLFIQQKALRRIPVREGGGREGHISSQTFFKRKHREAKKEKWSIGLELETLLENATSERGLNEGSHKVKDHNYKEEALRVQEIERTRENPIFYYSVPLTVVVLLDGVCGIGVGAGGVGGHHGGTGGGCKTCLSNEKKVKLDQCLTTQNKATVQRDSEELREQFQSGKSEAEERYKSNVVGGLEKVQNALFNICTKLEKLNWEPNLRGHHDTPLIAVAHWKLKIGKLGVTATRSHHNFPLVRTWNLSATRQYRGVPLEIDY
ncbi:hypothetical protein CQW23_23823 [Capsicum baccatum]|uniref:Uncharacterized protein n=1 Tax=Capsicum baccatum TaxID=33114 RepID=A0A2G2VT52_CAPBA|nr:hypothetical protein CQW23_23823 [Capsicum baccatum]